MTANLTATSIATVHHMALVRKSLVRMLDSGAIKCINDNALIIHSLVDHSSEPLSTTSQKHHLAYLLLLTARSFRPMYMQLPTPQPAHLNSASSQDGVDMQ